MTSRRLPIMQCLFFFCFFEISYKKKQWKIVFCFLMIIGTSSPWSAHSIYNGNNKESLQNLNLLGVTFCSSSFTSLIATTTTTLIGRDVRVWKICSLVLMLFGHDFFTNTQARLITNPNSRKNKRSVSIGFCWFTPTLQIFLPFASLCL